MSPPIRRPRQRALRIAALAVGLLAGAVGLRAARDYEVARPTESLHAAPEGTKVGELLEGTRVEEVARDGRWVKVRVEGWIWGPSLEGFEGGDEAAPSARHRGEGESARRDPDREPRSALSLHLDEIRELIDERYGLFYGLRRDGDLNQLLVRLRVRDLEREALERRQMRLQHEVLQILAGEVEFESLRVESNRPDGTGEVGVEVAVTSAADIRRVDGHDLALWRQTTRRSADGGKTWTAGSP